MISRNPNPQRSEPAGQKQKPASDTDNLSASHVATGDSGMAALVRFSADGEGGRSAGCASTLHVGERVGQFEIVEFVGNGAFGEVFRARDHELSRDVALKIQRTDVIHAPAIKSVLMREARGRAAVRHANICTIYQFMQVHNRPCIVMAFIEGETLASRSSGPVSGLTTARPPSSLAKWRWAWRKLIAADWCIVT